MLKPVNGVSMPQRIFSATTYNASNVNREKKFLPIGICSALVSDWVQESRIARHQITQASRGWP